MKKHLVLTLLFLSCLITTALASDAAQIMGKVLQTQRYDSAALDLKLTLIESDGLSRERRIQMLSKTEEGLTSSLTVFLSPENVRNTRFLSVEQTNGKTEQWIYLPALKRSRRIAASEENTSFMGSDFTYADMASTTYDQTQASHTLLDENEDSWRIESVPFDQKVYGKTITVVEKESYLPLRVEFYDLDQKTLVKTLVTEQTDVADGRPITRVVLMQTEASGHATRLEMLQTRFGQKLDNRYFTQKFLETGRL